MSEDARRLSFDSVADAYERGRPPYAQAAVAWIAERLHLGRVLDLAAVTGKLTRQLVVTGADVVAVEPGEEMRAVFARVLPGVDVLAGTAESIPLPAASVDAVTVGEAFHWFRVEEALAEMHRVLRPHGGVALFWKPWDGGDAFLTALDEIVRGPRLENWRDRFDAALFASIEERTFSEVHELTTDSIVDWVASTSTVAVASADERACIEAEVRELAGADQVTVSVATDVAVFDRV